MWLDLFRESKLDCKGDCISTVKGPLRTRTVYIFTSSVIMVLRTHCCDNSINNKDDSAMRVRIDLGDIITLYYVECLPDFPINTASRHPHSAKRHQSGGFDCTGSKTERGVMADFNPDGTISARLTTSASPRPPLKSCLRKRAHPLINWFHTLL